MAKSITLTPKEIERFWSKVDRKGEDDCWEWTAYRHRQGYGVLHLGGRKTGFTEKSHRVAWTITNGPIVDGLCVLHRCDNTSCCNPSHLWLGTQLENIHDAQQKGRSSVVGITKDQRGELNRQAKLNADQVREIRNLYSTGDYLQQDIAQKFDITFQTVSQIIRRKSWKHIY